MVIVAIPGYEGVALRHRACGEDRLGLAAERLLSCLHKVVLFCELRSVFLRPGRLWKWIPDV